MKTTIARCLAGLVVAIAVVISGRSPVTLEAQTTVGLPDASQVVLQPEDMPPEFTLNARSTRRLEPVGGTVSAYTSVYTRSRSSPGELLSVGNRVYALADPSLAAAVIAALVDTTRAYEGEMLPYAFDSTDADNIQGFIGMLSEGGRQYPFHLIIFSLGSFVSRITITGSTMPTPDWAVRFAGLSVARLSTPDLWASASIPAQPMPQTPPPAPPAIAPVLPPAPTVMPRYGETSGIEVTILSVVRPYRPTRSRDQPAGGRELALISLRIANGRGGLLDVRPYHLKLQTADGVIHERKYLLGAVSDELNSTTLIPGRFVTGALIYEVPVGMALMFMHYDPSVSGVEPIDIPLE